MGIHVGIRLGGGGASSVQTASVSPYISGSLYPGGVYSTDAGTWTNSPTLTQDLEASADGVSGWASQGDPGTTGTWATGLAAKYLRLKVIPNGVSANAAYSAVFGPLGALYEQVLNLAGNSNYLTKTVTTPFAGVDLLNGADNGLWLSCMFYYSGSGFESGAPMIALGSTSRATTGAELRAESCFFRDNTTGASATNTGVVQAAAGWYISTARFFRTSSTLFQATHMVRELSTTGTAVSSAALDLNNFTELRIGDIVQSTGLSNTTNNDCPIAWVAWGKGNPAAAHTWAYNSGDLRNIWDYPSFGSTCSVVDYCLLSRANPGNTTFTNTEADSHNATVTGFTQTGSLAWVARRPGFVYPGGDAPAVPATFVYPMIGRTDDTFILGTNLAKIGSATPASFTAWTLTHSVLGDISGTVTTVGGNKQFTCATPGTIDWSITYTGAGTATGSVALGNPIEILAPTSGTVANPLYRTAFNGNGRAAMIPAYTSPGAGTTYANAAALQTAINAMGAGTTLIVDNLSAVGSTVTITARDFGGATITCTNNQGVQLAGMIFTGCSNLTIRGIGVVNTFSGTGVTGITLDYCRGTGVDLKATSLTRATATATVTNWCSWDDGTARTMFFQYFNRATVTNFAHGNTAVDSADMIRMDQVNTRIIRRGYIGQNGATDLTFHPDAVQAYQVGSLGYIAGLIDDVVIIDVYSSAKTNMQGLFHSDGVTRFLRYLRCAVKSSLSNSIVLGEASQGCGIEQCFGSATVLGESNSLSSSLYVANNIKGASGSTILASAGLGTETGTTASGTSLYPDYGTYPLQWEMWGNPTGAAVTTGPYALIAELVANKAAYP